MKCIRWEVVLHLVMLASGYVKFSCERHAVGCFGLLLLTNNMKLTDTIGPFQIEVDRKTVILIYKLSHTFTYIAKEARSMYSA